MFARKHVQEGSRTSGSFSTFRVAAISLHVDIARILEKLCHDNCGLVNTEMYWNLLENISLGISEVS